MGVARFEFADLCVKPLGALDYLAIARSFHTVMISGIPKLSPHKKDEARRFVNLIDTLYDGGVCLIAAAEAEPHQLYPEGDVAFLFERTASRLIEMRSAEYMQSRQHRAGLGPSGRRDWAGRCSADSGPAGLIARPLQPACRSRCQDAQGLGVEPRDHRRRRCGRRATPARRPRW